MINISKQHASEVKNENLADNSEHLYLSISVSCYFTLPPPCKSLITLVTSQVLMMFNQSESVVGGTTDGEDAASELNQTQSSSAYRHR